MKAYFTLPNLLTSGLILDPNYKTNFRIASLKVDEVDQLTPVYHSENPPNFTGAIIPTLTNNWGFAGCTQLGSYPSPTSIDSCNILNPINSFNPFASSLKLNYSDIVGGVKRGEIVNSVSGNFYGIEPFKFGFDKIDVPINPIPAGTVQGAYYVEFDETLDFSFVVSAKTYTLAGTLVNDISFAYVFDATNCSFYARKDETDFTVFPLNVVTTYPNSVNWLSGGLSGWITPDCDGEPVGNCDPIVTQSICFLAQQPQTPVAIFGDLEGCCYISPVLAHLTENDEWKNDINSFLLKRNFSTETIDLVLQKNGITDIPLIDNTYGTYCDFGYFDEYPNYKGYKIEWQKVLQVEGIGNYRLKATSNLISGTVIEYSIPFQLQEYTENKASGTVRIQSVMDGYLRHRDFDFKGLRWFDGLRIRGFFGNRQAEYEQEQIIYSNRQSRQLRSEMINVYTLQTMHIPSCITDAIIEYHNFANELFITDYNRKNHKGYVQIKVVFDTMESIDYKSVTDLAPIEIKYKDYLQNYLKSNC